MRWNCVDDIVCLLESTEHEQSVLDRLVKAAAPLGICFAPSACKRLLQDGTVFVPNIILTGGEPTIVDSFSYLDFAYRRMVARQYRWARTCSTEALKSSDWYFTEVYGSCVLCGSASRSAVWMRGLKYGCRRCSSFGDFHWAMSTYYR